MRKYDCVCVREYDDMRECSERLCIRGKEVCESIKVCKSMLQERENVCVFL